MSPLGVAPSASPWDRRRLQVSLEFERVAVALFASHGYGQVTYDDVAIAAGVSSRTVYRYFPAKEDFLLAEVRRSAATIEEALRDVPRTDHPITDVVELLITLSEAYREDLDWIILWSTAVSSDADAASRVQGEQSIVIEKLLLEYCLDARDESPVDPMALRPVAATAAAIMQVVFQQWVEGGGQDELPTLYRAALDGVRAALRPADATATAKGRIRSA